MVRRPPSLLIVRTGSAATYLYGMICVNPFRICSRRCDSLLGLELPKPGGAPSKERRFQRASACKVFTAGRTARRSVFITAIQPPTTLYYLISYHQSSPFVRRSFFKEDSSLG